MDMNYIFEYGHYEVCVNNDKRKGEKAITFYNTNRNSENQVPFVDVIVDEDCAEEVNSAINEPSNFCSLALSKILESFLSSTFYRIENISIYNNSSKKRSFIEYKYNGLKDIFKIEINMTEAVVMSRFLKCDIAIRYSNCNFLDVSFEREKDRENFEEQTTYDHKTNDDTEIIQDLCLKKNSKKNVDNEQTTATFRDKQNQYPCPTEDYEEEDKLYAAISTKLNQIKEINNKAKRYIRNRKKR